LTAQGKLDYLLIVSENEHAIFLYRAGKLLSAFKQRTEDSSAMQYFQFYGYLSQQQNMMQDYIRTSTYQKAIMSNLSDFQNKVVLDVGAGSGILSFFAQQAGAKTVRIALCALKYLFA
jgi:histone-arginine methyltransferase CARM1